MRNFAARCLRGFEAFALIVVMVTAFKPEPASALTNSPPAKVYISYSGTDSVGEQVYYWVRQDILKSADLTLVKDYRQSWLEVYVITEDTEGGSTGERGLTAAISTTITVTEVNGTSGYDHAALVVCGLYKVQSCAGQIVADISNTAAKYQNH
nr:hypothetical protein [uncultured Acidocella sp.]